MNVTWYDLSLEEDTYEPGWFEIDRIYCFDWESFKEDDWERLNDIYVQLPGCRENTGLSFPRWFSDSEDLQNGYLWASIEPPGLQVAGTLQGTDWQAWHEKFISLITGLPARDIR